jgi:glutaminyl-tRNA synthetase
MFRRYVINSRKGLGLFNSRGRAVSSSFSTDPANGGQLLNNFVTHLIDEDIEAGKNGGQVVTRFPPEPNGYLHLGHAKAININFGIARAYNGQTNMRFDDTNPVTEDMEYVNSILNDVRWLLAEGERGGNPWNENVKYASDYFQIFYDAAEYLIKQKLAFVDDLSSGKTNKFL